MLFFRVLGQRLPLHIGDTSLGLKYLLINSKYSCGEDMKLPMYSSTSFRKHLEPYYKEEIIGDIHLSFYFQAENKKHGVPRPRSVIPNKDNLHNNPPKVTLESKPVQGKIIYL